MKRFVLAAIACMMSVPAANAQIGKSPQLVKAFGDTATKVSKSSVRVLADGKEAALGVIVSSDAWILTKHSVVKGAKLTCRFPGGKEIDATLHGHDVPTDLALLKTEPIDLPAIDLIDSKASRVGHWIVCPDQNGKLVAAGVLSVAAREVKGASFQMAANSTGYLGLGLDIDYAGVKVSDVFPNTPAQKSGLKANDIVLKTNGREFQSADEFLAFMSTQKPGNVVEFKLERDEMEVDLKVTIGARPDAKGGKSRADMQNSFGSKLSERRGGFPIILTHDAVLRPEDCGGALVNLDGKVLGINISRAGRTETFAIPSEVVRPLVERLKSEEKRENADPSR